MKNSGLLVLGGATVALFAYLGATPERSSAVDSDRPHLFLHFDPTTLHSITIEKAGTAPTKLERASDDDPHAYDFEKGEHADSAKIGSLLTSLETASSLRRFATDAEIRGKKALTLRFAAKEGDFVVDLFGDESTPGRAETFCCEEPREPRFCGTLARSLAERLARPSSHYRDARVVPWPLREIAEIAITEGGKSTTLRSTSIGFENEKGDRLERGSVEAALRILLDTRLLRESDEKPVENPSILRLVRKGGEAQSLSWSEGCSGSRHEITIGFAFGSRFCAPGSILRAKELLGSKIDRHLVPFRQDEIDHVVLEGPRGRLDVVRKDADFELLGASPRRLDRERGRSLFSYLASLEGEPVPRPAAPSALEWSFFGFGSSSDAPTEFRVHVHFTAAGVIASTEKQSLLFQRTAILEGAPESLASLALLAFEPSDLVSLDRSGKRREEIVRPGDNPSSMTPVAEEIIELLSHLHAETYLEATEAKEAEKPLATFSLSLKSSSTPRTLHILHRTLGGYVATLDGQVRPFLLSRSVGDVLTSDLASIPLAHAEDLEKRVLILATPLGTLSFVPEEEGYRVEPERRLSDPDAFLERLFELRGTPFDGPFRPNPSPLLSLRARADRTNPSFELVIHQRATFRDRGVFIVTSTTTPDPLAVETRSLETLLESL